MPTQADLDKIAEDERSSFLSPTALSAKRQAETAAILEAGAGNVADDADNGVAGGDADGAKLTDDERAAKAVADGDAAGKEGKEAKGEDGKAKGEESGKDGEQLPDWLKRRSDRVATKERTLTEKEQAITDREKELDEREAALKAAPAKVEEIKAPTKPKPADFDDVETFEAARDKFDAELKTFNDETARRAAEAAKPKPKAETEKKADAAPQLPAGITQADLDEATGNIANVLTKEQSADLSDAKKVPNLTAAVVIHLGDQGKERTKEMADFIVNSPKTMAAIAALPPIRQAASFERAFVDRPKPKKQSEAPAPITRLGGGAKVGTESYSEYEARRNAEDVAERLH